MQDIKPMDNVFNILSSEVKGIPVLTVVGDCDASNCDIITSKLSDLMNKGHTKIILDIRRMKYLDGSAYHYIVKVNKELRSMDGYLIVVDWTLPLERGVTLMGLDRLITIVGTPDQAAAHFMHYSYHDEAL